MISAPWPGGELRSDWARNDAFYTRPSQDRCEPCSTRLSSGAGLSMACATVSPTQVFTCSAACTKWSPSGSAVLNVASLRASDVTLHHHVPYASVHKFGSPHRLATHNRQGEPDRGKTFLLSWKPDEGKKIFHLKAWWGTFLLSERLTRIFLSPEGLRWDIFHLKAWRTFLSSETLMRDNISFI